MGKAAALLRKNNSNVLAGNFVNFNYETKQGGAEAVDPSEAEIAALNKSKALWIKLGGATPLIAYQTRSGDSKILLGTNEEAINEVLKQLTLPAGFKKP